MLGDLFTSQNGDFDIQKTHINGKGEYVITAGLSNNGILGKSDVNAKIFKKNTITVDMFCNAFYQDRDFYAVSHGRVNILYPKFNMSPFVGLFIVSVIRKEQYKFSYGRAVYSSEIRRMQIKLPTTAEGMPDWDFMESYIKTLNYKYVSTRNKNNIREQNIGAWKECRIGDLFDVKKGRRLTADEQIEGETPYIGAIDSNNGVANYIGQEAIHDGNTISLSYNGSVGEAFYQPAPFWATDDVNVLYFKKENGVQFNKYIALFICTVLKQEKYRYSYGRKWVLENMRETIIKLPVREGKPDFEFMENYIKSLPYGDRI